MTAVAVVQLAQDLVTLECHPWPQWRWQWQGRGLLVELGDHRFRQRVDTHHLDRQVVPAPLAQRFLHNQMTGPIQIVMPSVNRIGDEILRCELVDAVRHQHEGVAHLQRIGLVVDFQMFAHTQGPAEIALLGGCPQAVVFGELLKAIAGEVMDAGIADMKEVHRGGFDDDRAEGADIASIQHVAVGTVAGLRVQPGIGGIQHPLRRGFHRPGFRGGVIIFQKPAHGGFAGDMADIAAADPVGESRHGTLRAEQRFARDLDTGKILIDGFAPLDRALAECDAECCHHHDRGRPGPSENRVASARG